MVSERTSPPRIFNSSSTRTISCVIGEDAARRGTRGQFTGNYRKRNVMLRRVLLSCCGQGRTASVTGLFTVRDRIVKSHCYDPGPCDLSHMSERRGLRL